MAGGCSAAKALWSKVTIFLEVVLRQGRPLQEVDVSSDEEGAHRKTDRASDLSLVSECSPE